MRVWISVIAATLAATGTIAGGLADDANAYIENAIVEHRIPAISAGIAVDGEIVWTGAAGFADVQNKRPATTETVFRIASISKVLTAAAILQLAESDRIDLNAPVQKYLADYPPPRKGTMTVGHLLAHTSGIRHSTDDESRTLTHYESMRDACRLFEDRKLAFVPGTKYRYTSYGYTVLGAILESVTGTSFESHMAENVWKPAGMTRTGLDRRPAQTANTARLYRIERGKVVPDVDNDLSLIHPAGGMVSTAEDLLRFTIALDDGLLSEESRDRMFEHPTYRGRVLDEQGGLGWNVWDHEGHGRILMRVGGQSGTSALLVSYRDRGVTVALLTNIARLDSIWELTNDLIGMGLKEEEAR